MNNKNAPLYFRARAGIEAISRVIVADDDRDSVATLTMILLDEGYDVCGVQKGSEVLQTVEEFRPHALLLDIHMPDVSGYEIARRMVQRRGPKPLMVAISGVYKKGSDRVLAEILGFDEYVTKPYKPDDLLKLLGPPRT